ncbi:MAG: hypothetical protein ABIF09_05445 [Gemmatimonadota bacterium]
MRMARVLQLAMVLSIACVGLFGCASDETTGPPPDAGSDDELLAQREEEEAEMAALWLSGELTAPDSLCLILKADLHAIRAEFRDEFPAVDSLWFEPPWTPGHISIYFRETVCGEIREGSYDDWDELNATFGLVGTRIHLWPWGKCTVGLDFETMLHPRRLAEHYGPLRGVSEICVGYGLGDYATLYPWETGGIRTYLFRKAWGDCPAGCIYKEYAYFRVMPSGPVLVGYYAGGTPPEWWEEARAGIDAFSDEVYRVCQ